VVGNTLEREEVEELKHATDLIQVDTTQYTRTYLEALSGRGAKCCALFPIRHDNQLFGVLTLGSSHPIEAPDDEAYAKQLADRLAVGLSNARLVEDLDKLNQGTFMALARAIDAKSTWTAGHSERVTKMAVEIGKAMRLEEKDLVILHRGGLLHDIGKIGTPPEILDKPGKMTEPEARIMCEHVTVGARILEPIPGFADLIPIVVQHHERFDGSGYPFGLAGEEINLHARIFAVADVYDALISNRPYRPGWAREKVIAYIHEKAGTHFDPRVVDAFLQVMSKLESTPTEAKQNTEEEEPRAWSEQHEHHRSVLRVRAATASHSGGHGRRG
jgi:putative nucleotidyltransferase with HDIG domain